MDCLSKPIFNAIRFIDHGKAYWPVGDCIAVFSAAMRTGYHYLQAQVEPIANDLKHKLNDLQGSAPLGLLSKLGHYIDAILLVPSISNQEMELDSGMSRLASV